MTTQEEINQIFEKWEKLLGPKEEEYQPEGQSANVPIYIPSNKSAKPKPLTIEEYRARQKSRIQEKEKQQKEKQQKTRRPSAGKAVRARQRVAELYKIVRITKDINQKNKLLKEIRLEKLNYNKTKNE